MQSDVRRYMAVYLVFALSTHNQLCYIKCFTHCYYCCCRLFAVLVSNKPTLWIDRIPEFDESVYKSQKCDEDDGGAGV